MAKKLQSKLFQSFNIFTMGLCAAVLLACGGGGMLGGLGNRADGDGSGQQGAALDEIARNDFNGPMGGMGPGGGTGGGMTGPLGGGPGDDSGSGSTPPSGGGGSTTDPFGGVDGDGSNVPGGSSCESSGGIGSCTQPVDTKLVAYTISVKLYADPATQGGNCNDLWPPEEERKVCGFVKNERASGWKHALKNLVLGTAWALPAGGGLGDETQGELVCWMEPYQPPISDELKPKIELTAETPFSLHGGYMFTKTTLIPICSPDGTWLAKSEVIKVENSDKGWIFQLNALYKENGIWVSKGTKRVQITCDGECSEKILPPLNPIIVSPIQGGVMQAK